MVRAAVVGRLARRAGGWRAASGHARKDRNARNRLAPRTFACGLSAQDHRAWRRLRILLRDPRSTCLRTFERAWARPAPPCLAPSRAGVRKRRGSVRKMGRPGSLAGNLETGGRLYQSRQVSDRSAQDPDAGKRPHRRESQAAPRTGKGITFPLACPLLEPHDARRGHNQRRLGSGSGLAAQLKAAAVQLGQAAYNRQSQAPCRCRASSTPPIPVQTRS